MKKAAGFYILRTRLSVEGNSHLNRTDERARVMDEELQEVVYYLSKMYCTGRGPSFRKNNPIQLSILSPKITILIHPDPEEIQQIKAGKHGHVAVKPLRRDVIVNEADTIEEVWAKVKA